MEHEITKPIDEFLMWGFLALFIIAAICVLTFAHFTMRRIEKEIKRDGVDYIPPISFSDGGMVYYAFAIVVTERAAVRLERLINASVVRSYATKTDW